eukprot:TRINITY_DN104329_c0_g1_i1.p1 TRINITY_DN104329_c0_g1~~TRINITY_DN104329_c0_g1_i1.p1  ORF type:complete len:211 (+),score=38.13 TRINITY_DN104329_c0_g1_i1:70-633(+)
MAVRSAASCANAADAPMFEEEDAIIAQFLRKVNAAASWIEMSISIELALPPCVRTTLHADFTHLLEVFEVFRKVVDSLVSLTAACDCSKEVIKCMGLLLDEATVKLDKIADPFPVARSAVYMNPTNECQLIVDMEKEWLAQDLQEVPTPEHMLREMFSCGLTCSGVILNVIIKTHVSLDGAVQRPSC